MAITLPLPVRVAAGILGAGIDLLKALPDDIPALPVTLVGNAMRLSMKVQQEIAALATRGDELIGGVIGAPEECPAWATFDDEPVEPVTRLKSAPRPQPPTPKTGSDKRPAGAAASGPATSRPSASRPAASRPSTSRPSTSRPATPSAAPPAASPESAAAAEPATLSTPEATAMPPVTTTAMDAALEMPQSVLDSATEAVETGDQAQGDVALTEDLVDDALAEEALAEERELVEEALTDEVLAEEALVEELVEKALIDEAIEEGIVAAAIAEELVEEAIVEELVEEAIAQELVEEAIAEEVAEETLTGDLKDEPAADDQPVIFEETEELTAALPIPEELLEEVAEAAQDRAAHQGQAEQDDREPDGPAALPDYDRMTLAQVRGHLRELSAADVSELLRYEQDGDNRAPFLTLLSNRLVTLDAQNS